MHKAKLVLLDGREIPVLIRNRVYRKLAYKIERLPLWGRFKLLFLGRKGGG